MDEQEILDYERVANAIDYIRTNFKEQPALEQIAAHVHLSPYHFQKLFSKWAGTTPKKFLQFISVEYAKSLLCEKQTTLFDTAFQTGLSGTGRLLDLFVNIEGMTPAEFRNRGKDLQINYGFCDTPFGPVIIGATAKGICHLAFYDDQEQAVNKLAGQFPLAVIQLKFTEAHGRIANLFSSRSNEISKIRLHVKGSPFQIKVWQALLTIPEGQLSTYGKIAGKIGNAKASRAVGTAIGTNPVAYLIPCHRVIQSGGQFGGYMWGSTRKAAIIGWEQAKTNP